MYLGYLDYDKLDEYVERSCNIIEEGIMVAGKLDYNERYTCKELIDMRPNWFDEYWFVKYDGLVDYASIYRGNPDYEHSELFLELLVIYRSCISNIGYNEGELPFNYVIIDVDDYNQYTTDELFNYSASVNVFKRYVFDTIPLLMKQCDFEYKLTNDYSVYNKLFVKIFALREFSSNIEYVTDYTDFTCYNAKSRKTLENVVKYLTDLRDRLKK